MKKSKLVFLVLASTFVLSACGNSEAGQSSGSKESTNSESSSMVVSTFGLSEDIVKSDIMDPFAKDNDVSITLDLGNSADRYTKFATNPSSSIDVMELSQNNATEGINTGLFLTITEKEVPNIANLTDSAKEVYESGAGIPIAVNSIGIIYDKAAVGHEISSWNDLWSSDLKGKIAIPDISVTAGPLFMYVASDHAGTDISKDKGKGAFSALKKLKPNVVKTYSKSSDLANMFQSGEISVAVVADFGVGMIQKSKADVTYVVPESGTYANFNTINIPKDTKNKELALSFVNYRISEESQKTKAISLGEGPTSSKVELTDEEASNLTYGDIADRAKAVDFNLINDNMTDWVDQWNNLMNN